MVSEVNGPTTNVVPNINQGTTKVDETKSVDAAQPSASSKSDVVSITDLAGRLQELTKAVEDAPVVDKQRVEQLRQEIESGTYQVDSDAVAEKLGALENMLGTGQSS